MFDPNARILVLGAGREGMATVRYLQKKMDRGISLYDQKPLGKLPQEAQEEIRRHKKTTLLLGGDLTSDITNKYDILIRSPGIPPRVIPQDFKGQVTSATQIFFDEFQGKILGVTGTKGKSTTTSLLFAMLQAEGKKAVIVGNIGKPALDALALAPQNAYAVFELSSHQLLDLTASPHIAVVLGIFEEHLDYYRSVNDYVQAKANIAAHQSPQDYVIYNEDNIHATKIAKDSQGKKIPFGEKNIKEVEGIRTKLQGNMNMINILAAKKAAEAAGCSQEAIRKAAGAFEPLPHRLEPVGEVEGVVYYNDSLATTPQATIEALRALQGVTTLIVGGFDRGLRYDALADAILGKNIKTLILFPETGEKIWEEIVKKKEAAAAVFNKLVTSSMREAVAFAANHTKEGEVCLLSPAAASFNLFRDYQERGSAFTAEVARLKKQ